MKKYLVIGNPIEHSLSPLIHNYWMRKHRLIDSIYEKQKVEVKDLKNIVNQVRNEELKGVNRKQCIELIMQWSNIQLSKNEINIYLEEKNNIYNGFIKNLNQNDVCEGVLNFINEALKKNIKIALYSASRNAKKNSVSIKYNRPFYCNY